MTIQPTPPEDHETADRPNLCHLARTGHRLPRPQGQGVDHPVTPTRAHARDIPSLAWMQAEAYARTDPTQHPRPWLAALTYPAYLLTSTLATAGGRLFHTDHQATATIERPDRIHPRELVTLTAITILTPALLVPLAALHPFLPATLVLFLFGLPAALITATHPNRRQARAGTRALKVEAAGSVAHLVCVARAPQGRPGIATDLMRALAEQETAQGRTIGCTARTPKHLGLYARADFVPVGGSTGMLYRP